MVAKVTKVIYGILLPLISFWGLSSLSSIIIIIQQFFDVIFTAPGSHQTQCRVIDRRNVLDLSTGGYLGLKPQIRLAGLLYMVQYSFPFISI